MKLFHLLLVLTVGLFLTAPANALSTDRDQPAEIEADDIEFDFKKGTRTYTNNVLVIQGTLRIKADKVNMVYSNDELELATAWGSLARFKQRPDGKQTDTEGWGRKIIVDQKQNTITLIGQAALKQGPNTARGETIIYNMANDTMRLKGSAKVGAAGKDGQPVPTRKIKDPFTENTQGPPEAAVVKPGKKTKKAKKASDETLQDSVTESSGETAEVEDTDEEPAQPAPTRSGRSRLIIQPK